MLFHRILLLAICFVMCGAEGKEHIGPEAPQRVFRMDLRNPNDVFVSGGAGFQSWRQSRGLPGPGPNLMQHVQGRSIVERTSDFVSTTGSQSGLNAVLDGFSSPGMPDVWVYRIAPNEDAYNVNWCWEDMTSLTNYQESLWRRYQAQDEWVFIGGIRLNQIESARRWIWNDQMRWYEEDESPGSYVVNPHFAPTPHPSPQRINPMRESTPDRFTTVYGYEPHEPTPAPEEQPSIEWLPSLGASCLGIAFSSGLRSNRNFITGCSFANVKEFKLETPTIPSKIVFTSQDKRSSKCAVPETQFSQRYQKWETYWQLIDYRDSYCDLNKAVYDQFHRLNFYYHDTDLCLAISPEFARKEINDEELTLAVCDYQSPLQKFRIEEGKIIPIVRPQTHIYFVNDFAFAGTKQANYFLDKDKMAKGFFDDPSMPVNYLTEIGLAWSYYSAIYYSTTTGWSSSYIQKTYYDTEKQEIFLMDKKELGQKEYIQPRCLRSYQVPGSFYNWYWTGWPECQTRGKASIPIQWDIEKYDNSLYVTITDGWKNNLWVVQAGQSPGYYFTSKLGPGYWRSTYFHLQAVQWRFHCTKYEKAWDYCVPVPDFDR